jgi:integrin alpha FG-GAP repeat containing protein 1
LNLQTPYTLFGLGRTNSQSLLLCSIFLHVPDNTASCPLDYVENLYIGTTLHSDSHFTSIEGVIPNSQVVISPPANPAVSWRWQLYLHPGEYVPWVTLSVVVATMVLAGIVGFLHLKERQEDELERRRDLGRLNFGAM